MKSIHATFFYKSLFIALVLCFSLGLTEIIMSKYDIENINSYTSIYSSLISLLIRIPLVVIFSELFLYLYYYYGIASLHI